MAFWLSKSRSISSLLGKRIGLLTILHERNKGSFLHSRRDGVFRYKNSPEFSTKSATFSATGQRFKSSKTGEQVELPSSDEDDDENQAVDFPGGRVAFTSRMNFTSESSGKRIPCFRVLDDNGYPIAGSIFEQVNKEVAVRMYSGMVTLQIMDTILYETQRQGRISFYLTSTGEEAINLASAAALSPDDVVLPQYREPGVLLWRGFTLQEFANQCFGNKADYGKGRQMPIHYGSQKHNYFTVSSPIATQLPQAAGVAYSLKMDKKDACVVTYMGDGGTSEGDFHAALNFAAVMEVPVIFICRNNGWAISTPITEQFRSDGVVVRGQAYGIRSIRVDGNDALAVYNSVRTARQTAINEQRPILIEVKTYVWLINVLANLLLHIGLGITLHPMILPNIEQWMKLNTGKQLRTLYPDLGNGYREMAGGLMKMNLNFAATSGSSLWKQFNWQLARRSLQLQTFLRMCTRKILLIL
ncbi:2-oxoisovalerate dehydrogenase subunit alpha 1, mitochondrial isoform X2 [Coffea arabica]|uniref:2-oxoisovalerate dehydrogenase subunit alpha 1, mitochondrial isoform X2 n=1 Tax=Coffea arabica TaxID=13443 RepID=A0ABM4VVN7_COFAR